MPKEGLRRVDAFSLWEVEVSHAVQLFYVMSSRRKLSLFDAEFESYSDRSIIKVS